MKRRHAVSPDATRPGFTLVELLAVITVVAILASMLLPALSSVRRSSYAARCIGNQRQLLLAAQMYWDEHEGQGFAERTVATNGGWRYWFGWLQDGAEGQRAFDPSQGALWPYARGMGIEACPALNQAAPWYKAKGRSLAYGYAYNLLLGLRGLSGAVMTQVAAPVRLAVFTDGGQVNTFLAPASPDHPMLEEFFYFDTNAVDLTVHFRHHGRAETGFADGHVDSLRPLPGSLDPRLPQEVIGRLDPQWVAP